MRSIETQSPQVASPPNFPRSGVGLWDAIVGKVAVVDQRWCEDVATPVAGMFDFVVPVEFGAGFNSGGACG
ncbi:MAG: hypothetical protein U0Q22_10875 [Acidimicrobiales bacterium]